MIGLVMRGLLGGGGGGGLTMLLGSFVAMFAIWGCCKLSSFRLRSYPCIKAFLRNCGMDDFDDFEVLVLVHNVTCARVSGQKTFVRVRAGENVAETDTSNKGLFQQPLNISIDQGTEFLEVTLMEGRKTLASLKLDIMTNIVEPKELILEKEFCMKGQDKSIVNPKIKLSIHREGDEETGLIKTLDVSSEADCLLMEQLAKVKQEEEGFELSETELLARSCEGPVETFGTWGRKQNQVLTIVGPPHEKKWRLCLWDGVGKLKKAGTVPSLQVSVLRINSVLADPSRAEVFCITYTDDKKVKQRIVLRRVDRSREVWIEMLTKLVKLVHELNRERVVAKESTKSGESFHSESMKGGGESTKRKKKRGLFG